MSTRLLPLALYLALAGAGCSSEPAPASGCAPERTLCDPRCVDLRADRAHCGACGRSCDAASVCDAGECVGCAATVCGNSCVDLATSTTHCGACGARCTGGACDAGRCTCPAPLTPCSGACVDLATSSTSCGACGAACGAGQVCEAGRCLPRCGAGETRCDGGCADYRRDWFNCGACGTACLPTESCQGGGCSLCTDCDGDGWLPDAGDCCDRYDVCARPGLVNPGAHEVPANSIDDNCNGLTDLADTLDLGACDGALQSRPADPMDFARAIGLCRTAVENPAPAEKRWGVISARLVQVDGAGPVSSSSASIRPVFGTLMPREGARVAVISSGIASDRQQIDPGPDRSGSFNAGTSTSIRTCADPACIDDWFAASRPPLKAANRLPEAPGCQGGTSSQETAFDSAMLHLRIRAPTNANAFRVRTRFFSIEYPEYVCSAFNDQVVLLVDTPSGATAPPNPPDKNLMTYTSMSRQWPIGVNLAKGTGLFQSCTSQASSPACWDEDVSFQSCGLGPADLALTQYDARDGGCLEGGGTSWLVTTGNVRPGEVFEVRAAVWDVGDHNLDSLLLLDDWQWSLDAGEPGTDER